MKQEVVNNIKKLRKHEKITQEELAQAIGVTRQTIIAMERGNYTPSVSLALKIAKYFRTPVEKIFKLK